jgi:hypothetical protein
MSLLLGAKWTNFMEHAKPEIGSVLGRGAECRLEL